ncbi:lipopolysaccharide biosynthesis protein [uncultured Tenacibaculum sp.]|uniref:lipopolysaccharide biosynthesis protein n=1 Tax=uncultured Tenacibaculum sp. TaxID=174713 RepID=UPI002629C360|nr:oligosaccharide flippase family protein [uncultured Tenacibaculum sp.]
MIGSLKKELIFSISIQVSVMFIGLVINKLISLNFGVETYSIYSVFKKTSGVISFIILGGMGIAIPKYLPQTDKKKDKLSLAFSAFYIVLVLAALLGLIVISFESFLEELVFGTNNNLILLCFFYSFIIALVSFSYAYLRGMDRIIYFNLSQLSVQLIVLTVVFFFTDSLQEFFLWSIISISIFVITQIVIELLKNRNIISVWKSKTIKPNIKELWSYGYSRLIGDFFLFSLNAIPLIIINNKFGNKWGGFFAAGITLKALINPIFSYIGIILLPKVSKSYKDKEYSQVDYLIRKFLYMYLIISVIVVAFIFIFNELLLKLFFSAEFIPAENIVNLIVLSILPNSLYLLLRNPIDAVTKKPYNTYTVAFSCCLGITLIYFSESIIQAAIFYNIIYVSLGLISFLIWKKIKLVNE